MYEIVKVRGVKYTKDHRNYTTDLHAPNGPLVPDPRFPSTDQVYIGWKRSKHEYEPDELGRVPSGIDKDPIGKDGFRLVRVPLTFKWEFDSAPIAVEKTPDISQALMRGELEIAEEKKGKVEK